MSKKYSKYVLNYEFYWILKDRNLIKIWFDNIYDRCAWYDGMVIDGNPF